MYSARNRNAVIADDTFQIQDWLRSNGNHDRGYPEFDYHHRIRPLSPVKRQRISATTDGKGPDRRRQLKSMESLLGLSDENLNGKNLSCEAVTRASPDVQDSLDRALMDFEETLELAFQSNSIVPPPRGFSNHNFVEGDESNFNKLDSSFDSYTTTGSSGYSTKPEHSMHRSLNTYNELQLIREQMVKSLEIIKDLEEQVKLVPKLKAQISSLSLEKQRLATELDKYKKIENANKITSGDRSPSSTMRKPPPPPPPPSPKVVTKDVGVSCVPMCRDVGVTTPLAATASTACASTMTDERPAEHGTRRAPPPRSVAACTQTVRSATAAAHTQTAAAVRPTTVAAHTQTTAAVKPTTAATHTQTAMATVAAAAATVPQPTATAAAVKPPTADAATQSARPVRTAAVGVTARPRTYDVCVTVKPALRHVGCTADVGPVAQAAAVEPTGAAVPVTRTTQTETAWPAVAAKAAAAAECRARGTQTPAAARPENGDREHRRTDGDVGRTTVGRRGDSFHQYPGAKDSSAAKEWSVAAKELLAVTKDLSAAKDQSGAAKDQSAAAKDQSAAKDSTGSSKIPRLKPVTPELNRKTYVRQDTYTKTAAETCTADHRLLPRVTDGDDDDDDDDDDKANESLSSTPEHQNGLPESEMNFKPIQDDMYKDNPSKEMKGALKVLHDSLKKTSATLLPRAQLKQAIDIVREEWFKVTSTSDSGGHLVKNYINWFTSYSPALLEFIINMTDAAGNTVLHYSISHGNFDVVSTILDTGVCNVNLTNDAGYSSVMLVSLAEIKNDDEMKIIKRLFKCGDVNLQAKKHGQTTLMLAVSHGKIEVVKLLLECGADLNMQDEDGSTALMCAAEHGLQEIINLLLSCPECDVSIADNDGSTALSIAMEAGHREIGIALYAKQHILSRENSPFNLSKTKRSRSANTVMSSNVPYSHLSLKKSSSLQPREYATLSSMLKTRTP